MKNRRCGMMPHLIYMRRKGNALKVLQYKNEPRNNFAANLFEKG